MPIVTEKYVRKPLYVDAVRITNQNFEELASWCQGLIEYDENEDGSKKKFIRVRTHKPINPRQTKGFVGDWILYTEMGYKVYTHYAFRGGFVPVEQGADEVVEKDSAAQTQEESEARDKDWASTPTEPSNKDEQIPSEPSGVVNEVPVMPQETPPVESDTGGLRLGTANGKRVLSIAEQKEMGHHEVKELVQSGEAVLAQDLAQ